MGEGGGEGAQAQLGHIYMSGGASPGGGWLPRMGSESPALSDGRGTAFPGGRCPAQGEETALPLQNSLQERSCSSATGALDAGETIPRPHRTSLEWSTGLPWGSLGWEERHSPTFRGLSVRDEAEPHFWGSPSESQPQPHRSESLVC